MHLHNKRVNPGKLNTKGTGYTFLCYFVPPAVGFYTLV